ncbi:MAG TPA: efflux RND transporter periplasmic adaptor subunit [Chloroflexota bacterium]|nr:efflux RND transporter periplasmic adaptor subunit [Chloroflexota bacterium]
MQIAAPIPRPVRRFLLAGTPGARPVLIGLLVLAVIAGAGVVIYQRFFAPAPAAPVGQIIPVQRNNVAATVSATGSVVATKQAKLVFANTGKIRDILVNVGDVVTAGQPLGRLVSDTTQVKLDTARSQLTTAQLKLQQLTETATAADLAAAQAAYDAAKAKLNDLETGPTAADLQAAQAAVVQAQAGVDDTTAKLQTLLSGPTSSDRASAVSSLVGAQNTLAAAQAKLDQLAAGPTTVDATTAQAAVADANSTLRSAQAKLDLLQAGATPADLAASQAAFDKANADVDNARVKLDQAKLTATLPPDVIAAQSALAAAESKVHTAHQTLDQLAAQLEQANADLAGQQSALTASIKSADQTCSKFGGSSGECAVARSGTDGQQAAILKAQQQVKLLSGNGSWDQLAAQKEVVAAQAAYDASAASLKQTLAAHDAGVDLIAAQTGYDTAVSQLTSARAQLDKTLAGPTSADVIAAQAAVDQGQTALATAQAKLDQTMQGATDADTVAAITAVQTSQANVDSAQAKLDSLGVATPQDVQSARSAQASALSGLESAQAKLAQLQAGPTQTDLEAAKSGIAGALATLASKTGSARSSDIALQQEAVRQAELALQQAQIDSDNNTLLAPFDGVVASVTGNPGEMAPTGTTGFISLIDPHEVRVDVTVDETDVARVAVGKPATLTFDAIPGRPLHGQVISVSPNGTLSQGVVTYPVSISLDTRNQVLPGGLTASATIIIDEKNDVLVAPLRAVRRQGREQVVEIIGDDGKPVTRVVTTGVQNDTLVEITNGLEEGDQLVVQGTTTRVPNGGGPGVPGIGGARVQVGR